MLLRRKTEPCNECDPNNLPLKNVSCLISGSKDLRWNISKFLPKVETKGELSGEQMGFQNHVLFSVFFFYNAEAIQNIGSRQTKQPTFIDASG